MKIIEKFKSKFFTRGEFVPLNESLPDSSRVNNVDAEVVKLTVVPKESTYESLKRKEQEANKRFIITVTVLIIFLIEYILLVLLFEFRYDMRNTISELQNEVYDLSEQVSELSEIVEKNSAEEITGNDTSELTSIVETG